MNSLENHCHKPVSLERPFAAFSSVFRPWLLSPSVAPYESVFSDRRTPSPEPMLFYGRAFFLPPCDNVKISTGSAGYAWYSQLLGVQQRSHKIT